MRRFHTPYVLLSMAPIFEGGVFTQRVPNNAYMVGATRIAAKERVSGFRYTYFNWDLLHMFRRIRIFQCGFKKINASSSPTYDRKAAICRDSEGRRNIADMWVCPTWRRHRGKELPHLGICQDLSGYCRPADAYWNPRMGAHRPDYAS